MGDYATASARREARKLLEELAASGDIRPAEKRELENLRALEKADEADIGATDAAYRGFAQNVTASAGDEIGAAARSLVGSQSYTGALDAIREKNKTAEAAYPDEYRMGGMAGMGAMSVLPFGGAAALGRGMGLMGNMALGGLTGAGVAALNDFNAGEGGDASLMGQAASRAENIDPGNVGAGFAVGSVAPVVGRAVGRVFADAKAPTVWNTARMGFDPKAARIAGRAFRDDAALSDDIQAYLSGLGPEGMIADAGQNTRNLAAGVAMSPGPGAQRLVQDVNARNAQTGARVSADVDAIGGGVVDQEAARLARKADRTATASPLYEAAKAHPGMLDAAPVGQMLDDLIAKRAPGARALAKFKKDFGGEMTAEVMHNLRSEIDGMARAAWQNNPAYGATYKKIVRALDERLDTIDGYARARMTWADSKALDDAAERGEKFLREDPEKLRTWFDALSEPEKRAYRESARRSLDLQLAKSVNEDTAARSIFKRRTIRDNVDMIFGPGSADRMASRTATEGAFAETRRKMVQSTDTAAKQAAQREIAPLVDEAGNRVGPIRRAKMAVEDPVNRVVDSILRRPQGKAMDDIGRILSATGERRDKIVAALLRDIQAQKVRGELTKRNQAILQAIMQSAGTGLAVAP